MGKLNEKDLCKLIDNAEDSTLGIAELFPKLEEPIANIADSMGIGFIQAVLQFPRGARDVLDGKSIFYEYEDGYDVENVFTEQYLTPEGGKMILNVYSRIGTSWDDEDRERLHHFQRLLYVLVGRARMARLLDQAINYDSMTGIYNQSGVGGYAMRLFATDRLAEYNGIFLNLKATKYINDNFGSPKGDEALRNYGLKVKGFLGDHGTIGRLGGDNFFIVVHKEFFGRLLEFLNGVDVTVSVLQDEKTVKIYARMGVYIMQSGDEVSSMFHRASLAYNETRTPGAKDFYYYSDNMQEKDLVKKQTVAMFREAVAERRFRAFYQPKIRLEDFTLCGAEALVRWVRDDRIVAPAEFVPILEKDGSICELDFYMLEEVCKDLREWMDNGIEPVKVSVNLSRAHFTNDNLVEDILAILEKYNIEKDYIEIEITESSCYEDYDRVLEFAAKIKEQGIHVSIDDFGTGFSSLSMLTNLDVDIIKLDKKFLDNVTERHGKDEILFCNIMKMILDLGLTAVAEGVETREQITFLKKLGCNIVQGYYFDQPLFKEVFEDRLLRMRSYPVV